MPEEEWQITRERLACPWCADEINTTELELRWEQDVASDGPYDGPFNSTVTCKACNKQFEVIGDFFVEWKARRVRHLRVLPNPPADEQGTGHGEHRSRRSDR